MRGDWKFVIRGLHGELSVIWSGLRLTQKLPAEIWGLVMKKVSIYLSTLNFKQSLYRVESDLLHILWDTSYHSHCCGLYQMFGIRELNERVHLLQPQLL